MAIIPPSIRQWSSRFWLLSTCMCVLIVGAILHFALNILHFPIWIKFPTFVFTGGKITYITYTILTNFMCEMLIHSHCLLPSSPSTHRTLHSAKLRLCTVQQPSILFLSRSLATSVPPSVSTDLTTPCASAEMESPLLVLISSTWCTVSRLTHDEACHTISFLYKAE